uniref:Homeobox C4 n=1 Tax=Dromaius novaehollandiae TaxID=8790 RepID=A0A8C4K126_DRONO
MIMSSYLMDSNYIDPKFPPCEEYSQNNYIPDHSPEYYSRTRESSYPHHHQELYPVPRPSFPDRQYSCASIQAAGNAAAHQRGPGPAAGGRHLPEKAQQLCEPAALSTSATTPAPAPAACGQPAPEHPHGTAAKQPVVYPWMKKIHVSTGMQLLFSSPSRYGGRCVLSPCARPPKISRGGKKGKKKRREGRSGGQTSLPLFPPELLALPAGPSIAPSAPSHVSNPHCQKKPQNPPNQRKPSPLPKKVCSPGIKTRMQIRAGGRKPGEQDAGGGGEGRGGGFGCGQRCKTAQIFSSER